ncbi:MAG: zeta toxin family protein [Bacteroidetes bacterium]|nr:zeta toxin family protein [Bacteroidota bacterium]MBU1115690.1 zeta toxin family protein [Bacteroidota bacterium]MBU1798356.1 zeta toxin family protein [Bacteroidota bacterium]
MKGDILVIEEHHFKAAKQIVKTIIREIKKKKTRYVITVAGESGSGKSETGKAIADELEKYSLKAALLGQDDYFVFPPKSNDAMRREDAEWLGPHVEVKLDQLENNLKDAIEGKDSITKPLVDYNKNSIGEEKVSLAGIKVIIAEGTYTSLLKNVDCKIFIARNRLDTLEHRETRNRGNEIGDPFIEQVLMIEHKIIAGHKQLADFIINKDYSISHIN